jgi:hypothetical protein
LLFLYSYCHSFNKDSVSWTRYRERFCNSQLCCNSINCISSSSSGARIEDLCSSVSALEEGLRESERYLCLYISEYICMYVFMIYVYICMYVFMIYIYIYIYIEYVYVWIYIDTYICICMFVFIYICKRGIEREWEVFIPCSALLCNHYTGFLFLP